MVAAQAVFWASVALIAYAYVGYPLLIVLLGMVIRRRVELDDGHEPGVTVLIAAYNEEKDIEAKLENTVALEYPREKLEIVVASDGSTDQTDLLVRRFAEQHPELRIVLHRVEGRQGKTAAQNSAVQVSRGEVIVFSDAASLYDAGVLRALVRNYADPEVGAVSGKYEYFVKPGSSVGGATILFWRLENFIKAQQSRIRTITGCSGCIYSLRKGLYTPLPGSIISDLVEPLTILQKGYRIVFEPRALALEETAGKAKDEFKMRIRVIVRGMNGMLFVRPLFNPLRYPFVALQLISHKVMRWLVPVFCITAFASNAVLVGTRAPFWMALFGLQLLFYVMALAGFLLERLGKRSKLLYLPLYFCIVNIASLISMFKVMKRENIVTWQTQR